MNGSKSSSFPYQRWLIITSLLSSPSQLWNQILQRATKVSHPITNLTVASEFPLLQESFSVIDALLSPLTSQLPKHSVIFAVSEEIINICFSSMANWDFCSLMIRSKEYDRGPHLWSFKRIEHILFCLLSLVKQGKLSCPSQICHWKLPGLRRWLDLLDKKAKPP